MIAAPVHVSVSAGRGPSGWLISVKCMSAPHNTKCLFFLDHKLSSVHEKERVLNGFGWYDVETMTVWGKSRLTRSLGDLWQLDHLKTLRFSGILKNLDHIRSNGGIKTLGALLQQHRVQFVIDFQPHIISVDTQQYLLLMSAPLYRQAPRWLS